jgi:hypothetical protein
MRVGTMLIAVALKYALSTRKYSSRQRVWTFYAYFSYQHAFITFRSCCEETMDGFTNYKNTHIYIHRSFYVLTTVLCLCQVSLRIMMAINTSNKSSVIYCELRNIYSFVLSSTDGKHNKLQRCWRARLLAMCNVSERDQT